MKTNKLILAVVFSLFGFFAMAQSNIERPISKDVQKIANKKALTAERLLHVASVGFPVWTITKGVQLTSSRLTVAPVPGNLMSTGYPLWIISKGVHKLGRPAIKPKSVMPLNPAIVRL
jgi:hypothetical protein